MTFTIAFNYGGRAEIVDAVRALVAEGIPADKIDERAIRRHLYDPDMPDPDLMVRTSGEYRISNFLLWEIAYSELVFTDVLWPDFRREHLFDAVREYQDARAALRRDRRDLVLYRDEGVVLRTYRLGEADRIVVLLHPASRQGAGRRQGRAQDQVQVRVAPRAHQPRGPPALRGSRARHRHPGRDASTTSGPSATTSTG